MQLYDTPSVSATVSTQDLGLTLASDRSREGAGSPWSFLSTTVTRSAVETSEVYAPWADRGSRIRFRCRDCLQLVRVNHLYERCVCRPRLSRLSSRCFPCYALKDESLECRRPIVSHPPCPILQTLTARRGPGVFLATGSAGSSHKNKKPTSGVRCCDCVECYLSGSRA